MKKSNAMSPSHAPAARQLAMDACHTQSDSARREDLARLLPLWPVELADLSIAGRRRIIARLERALRAERKRGIAGHWAYDLARHAALVKNWKSESAALREIERQELISKGALQIPVSSTGK